MNRKHPARSARAAFSRWLPAVTLAVAMASGAPGAEEMKLSVGRSLVLDRTADVARISISNPEVVDAVAVTLREILVNAKAAGLSSLVIWSKAGDRTMYMVTVERDLEPIRRLLKETFPEEAIDVRADRDALALVGRASNQGVADPGHGADRSHGEDRGEQPAGRAAGRRQADRVTCDIRRNRPQRGE